MLAKLRALPRPPRSGAGARLRPLRRLAAIFCAASVLAGCAAVYQPKGASSQKPAFTRDALIAADGARLPARQWLPPNRPPWAVLVALHGMNDYSNAFDQAAQYWAFYGVATYAYDQRGFGASARPGIWSSADTMVADLTDAVDAAAARHPGVPIYLLGESMGGAVLTTALASQDAQGIGRNVAAPGTDASMTDAPNTATPRAAEPGADAPGADAPGADAPGADAAGADAAGADAARADAPRADAPRADAPGADAPNATAAAVIAPSTAASRVTAPAAVARSAVSTAYGLPSFATTPSPARRTALANKVAGAILSAPAVWGRQSMNGLYRMTLWLGASTVPGLALQPPRGLKITASDNMDMLRALGRDPLVIKRTRLDALAGLVELMTRAQDALPHLPRSLPLLVMYGRNEEVLPQKLVADTLARLDALRPAPRLRVAVYEQGYHLLLRDRQAETVWRDVLAWMAAPDGGLPSAADQVGTRTLAAGPAAGVRAASGTSPQTP